ncbi:hypothetical protein AVEN_73188-1 [Araneus ventricosus]|uniref:Uncharacterized protein n=1 Tax=Araneus ventricosus TaxID=182803 RepID=A0A4Y2K7Q0_ARAVE|nr:hypothetical protein AVEN_73188-1 [Araneus ventricosus]
MHFVTESAESRVSKIPFGRNPPAGTRYPFTSPTHAKALMSIKAGRLHFNVPYQWSAIMATLILPFGIGDSASACDVKSCRLEDFNPYGTGTICTFSDDFQIQANLLSSSRPFFPSHTP